MRSTQQSKNERSSPLEELSRHYSQAQSLRIISYESFYFVESTTFQYSCESIYYDDSMIYSFFWRKRRPSPCDQSAQNDVWFIPSRSDHAPPGKTGEHINNIAVHKKSVMLRQNNYEESFASFPGRIFHRPTDGKRSADTGFWCRALSTIPEAEPVILVYLIFCLPNLQEFIQH